jgi:hypothetical protein
VPAAEPPVSAEPRARASRTTRSARQVDERRFVSSGMTDIDVLTRLGAPDRILHSGSSGPSRARSASARWLYLPAPGDSDTITAIAIDRGVVVDVERRMVR